MESLMTDVALQVVYLHDVGENIHGIAVISMSFGWICCEGIKFVLIKTNLFYQQKSRFLLISTNLITLDESSFYMSKCLIP